MYAAMSLARKHVTPAISSASPARCIGMCCSTWARLTGSSIHARLIGVTVAPGPTPLTRMPRLPVSGGAGADAVDADAAARVLERERPREVHHAALARRVAEVARLGDELVDARDVDDRAVLLLAEEMADRLA